MGLQRKLPSVAVRLGKVSTYERGWWKSQLIPPVQVLTNLTAEVVREVLQKMSISPARAAIVCVCLGCSVVLQIIIAGVSYRFLELLLQPVSQRSLLSLSSPRSLMRRLRETFASFLHLATFPANQSDPYQSPP
jgi:hypothetical protein